MFDAVISLDMSYCRQFSVSFRLQEALALFNGLMLILQLWTLDMLWPVPLMLSITIFGTPVHTSFPYIL